MKSFVTNMFKGNEGEVSHKRVLGTFGFMVMTITMSINALYPKELTPSTELIQAVEWLTISALFGTVVEKFAKK
jgi:hypothetical protein